jgi:hypothetical protein
MHAASDASTEFDGFRFHFFLPFHSADHRSSATSPEFQKAADQLSVRPPDSWRASGDTHHLVGVFTSGREFYVQLSTIREVEIFKSPFPKKVAAHLFRAATFLSISMCSQFDEFC